MAHLWKLSLPIVLAWLIGAVPAAAYIGPGAGIGAIGTVLALLAGVVLLIVGFVWYPIKRAIRRLRAKNGPPGPG